MTKSDCAYSYTLFVKCGPTQWTGPWTISRGSPHFSRTRCKIGLSPRGAPQTPSRLDTIVRVVCEFLVSHAGYIIPQSRTLIRDNYFPPWMSFRCNAGPRRQNLSLNKGYTRRFASHNPRVRSTQVSEGNPTGVLGDTSALNQSLYGDSAGMDFSASS